MFDHFQAMVTAIGSKLSMGKTRSDQADVVGGSTLSFDVHEGHPHGDEVLALLGQVRGQVNDLWKKSLTTTTRIRFRRRKSSVFRDDGQACIADACAARPELDPCADSDGALVCSSFESDDPDTTPVVLDGGQLAANTEQSLFGARALDSSVADGSTRACLHYPFEAQTAGTLYLRAWMYLDVDDASALHAHSITVGSVDTPSFGSSVHILDGKLGLSFPRAGDIAGTKAVPARQWFCVRATLTLGESDGSADIWLNDALSTSADGVDTLPPDGVHNMSVGIEYTDEPELRLFTDAVQLSTTPVGCLE